jgi:hypothetical protein
MDAPEPVPGEEPWRERLSRRITPMCHACVDVTGVDGGGVALLSTAGVRAVVCATDATSSALETLQIDVAEGPCVDAGTGPSPVLISDLRDPAEGVAHRWPFFLPQADAIGVRSVFAFPLRIGSIVLGTMELYRGSPGALQPRQLFSAFTAADGIAAAVVDSGQSVRGPAVDMGDVGGAAAAVHQAAGMVMVQQGGTINEAMALLRASSYAEGVSLITVSTEVIRGRRRFTKEQT